MKDSSVSMCAERELRLVEPKSVSTGGDEAFGETQIPEYGREIVNFKALQKGARTDLLHGTSSRLCPIR